MNNSAANTNGRSYAGNFGRSGSNGRQTGWSNRTFQGADTYNNGGRSFSGSIRWNNTNNRTLPNRSFNGDNGSRSNQGQSVDGRRFGNGSSTRRHAHLKVSLPIQELSKAEAIVVLAEAEQFRAEVIAALVEAVPAEAVALVVVVNIMSSNI